MKTYEKLGKRKQTEFFNVSEQNPTRKRTEAIKVLTKALAARLQKVLPSLKNPDKVGYMKNRFIGKNVRKIFHLKDLANIEAIEAYIAQIAFDSIE